MTTEERLRDAIHWVIDGNYAGLKQIDAMIDAQNRIRVLEAALREIEDMHYDKCDFREVLRTARKALGEDQ